MSRLSWLIHAAVLLSWGYSAHACKVFAEVESGTVCGLEREAEDGSVYASFRGVPYAKQPLGALRFKELQPLEPWVGQFNATNEGPICPQTDVLFGPLAQPQGISESCIHANIHVPIDALNDADASYPILVFIHGGGFLSGSGDADVYGPEYLVTQGVIVITFNYRLDVFGFLSLNSSSIPGNQGLRDQVTLLKWVQRNARSFGGDPDNVTLMGQSAGAASAHILSISKAAQGLFQRAIIQSGTAYQGFYTASPTYAAAMAQLLLNGLGINSTDAEEIHEQLIKLPLETIMKVNSVVQDVGLTAFVPVIESAFENVTRILDDDPDKLVEAGRGKNITLLIGFTASEAYTLQGRIKFLNVTEKVAANPALLPPFKFLYTLPSNTLLEIGKKISAKYFNGNVTFDKVLRYSSDAYFIYPAIRLAKTRGNLNGAPVYLYDFEYSAKNSTLKHVLKVDYKKAAHLEDLTYIFRTNSALGSKRSFPPVTKDDQMRYEMTSFIANYTKYGNPTGESLPATRWPAVSKTLKYQDISTPKVLNYTVPSTYFQDMTDFFDAIYKQYSTSS